MPNVLVRDVPEDVHAQLQARADERGQSLQQYLAGELRRLAERPTMDEVLANVVGDDATDGVRARAAIAGHELSVPDLVDVEVVSVLRRRWLAKTITARRFAVAVDDLALVPADRYPVLAFMPRAYELRANVSAYDATYVALAEQLGCVLVTADARLATAPGPRCPITLVRN